MQALGVGVEQVEQGVPLDLVQRECRAADGNRLARTVVSVAGDGFVRDYGDEAIVIGSFFFIVIQKVVGATH